MYSYQQCHAAHTSSRVFACSGVQYPAMVAEGDSEEAKIFNCTQRSHQNMLEQLPTFLAVQLLLAQAYPVTAGALGMVWNVGTCVRVGWSQRLCDSTSQGRMHTALCESGLILASAFC